MEETRKDAPNTNARPVLRETGGAVARLTAVERGEHSLPFGSKMYNVYRGWESDMIRSDKGVSTCDTLLDLEEALQNSSCKVVFVPKGAMMTDGDIEKLCRRNGVAKTIFKEVDRQ